MTAKIISGIVATISLNAAAFVLVPSFWFWAAFELLAALLVAYGCIGEWYLHHHPSGRAKREKDAHHKQEARYIFSVALGVAMEFFIVAHSIQQGVKMEGAVAQAQERAALVESNSLIMETDLAKLNKKTLELAHQYDLSTNALAEANARLASVRPLKQRLLDWFTLFAPTALSQLKSAAAADPGVGKRLHFKLKVGQVEYMQLALMITEPGALEFCGFDQDMRGQETIGNGGVTMEATVLISPALIK